MADEKVQQAEGPSITLAQILGETAKLSLSAVVSTVGQAYDLAAPVVDHPLFAHGRTELAAALFSGSGYVMYQRGQSGVEQGQDQPLHGPEVEQKQPEVKLEQDRGGMSM